MSVFTGTELSLELGMEGIVSGMSGMSGMSKMTNIMNEIITKNNCNMGHSHTHILWLINTEIWGNIFAPQCHHPQVVQRLKENLAHRVVMFM